MSADLRKIVQDVLQSGLRITEIITEPDGSVRVLTAPNDSAPLDPLAEARKKRENKGERNAHAS